MFNNEVTYDEKWKTEEAVKYHDKFLKEYGDKTPCCTHVPHGWAKEVYEFVKDLDETFGTWSYYHPAVSFDKESLYKDLVKATIDRIKDPRIPPGLKSIILEKQGKWALIKRQNKQRVTFYRVWKGWGKRAYHTLKTEALRRIKKPRIQIDQVKEKYGSLRFYYSCDDLILREYIDQRVCELEVKLAEKGCYSPLENLVNGGWQSSYSDYESFYNHLVNLPAKTRERIDERDGKEVKVVEYTDYKYRGILRERGHDLQELAEKARKKKEEIEKAREEAKKKEE